MNQDDFESVVDYKTVLSQFEGPLDLLLFLIRKNKINIEDIFVSEVTDQFLQYMQGLPYLDIDKVSEYLNIAATIIKIKAISLIPNLEDDPNSESVEDDEDAQALILALQEQFALIKEESKKLKALETVGYYYKEPDKNIGEPRIVYTDFNLDGLIAAFSALLLKQENKVSENQVREIQRDEYTVSEKISYIRTRLQDGQKTSFESLFGEDFTRPEIVTTFQAMLELLKHQYLCVTQNDIFGEIMISLNPDRKEDEDLGEIDEYN